MRKFSPLTANDRIIDAAHPSADEGERYGDTVYPADFATRTLEEKNQFFAREAAQYRDRKANDAAAVAVIEDDVEALASPAPSEPADLPEPPGELIPRTGVAGRESEHAPTPAERFPLVPWDRIKLDTAPAYLIKGFLPSIGLAIIWGEPKCGKTFWTLDLFAHIAAGREYRGHRVRQGCVVYCALEGKQRIETRIEALKQNQFTKMPSGAFQLMTTSLALINDHRALIAAIRAQLGDDRPAAVVIDTLNRSIVGSESDDAVMTAYIRATDTIRDAFDCLVAVVHHCGYEGSHPRGHSSQLGAYDALVGVRRDASGNVIAELQGSKDGAADLQFVSALKVVELGTDDEGDAITTCIVEPVEGPPAAKAPSKPAKKVPPGQRLLLDIIAEAIIEGGIPIQPFADGPMVKAVHDAIVRSRLYARIAEKADPNEDHKKLRGRQRKSFNKAVFDAINAKLLMAATHNGERHLWVP